MKYWPAILGAVMLAGCAHYQSQPLSPEESARQLESRRLDDPGLKRFLEANLGREITEWPKKNWTLEELTLVAFDYHPSLQVARAQWLVAAAGMETARARPNPTVSVSPGYDTQIPGNFSPWLVPVTFDQPIETAGKRAKRMAEAEKNSEAARWDFVSAAWQVRSRVRESLLDYTLAGRRGQLLEKQIVAQERIAELLRQRLAAGTVSKPEVTLVEIALGKARLELGDEHSRQAEARSRLAESLGLSESALEGENLNIELPATETATLNLGDARRAALQSRADVLAALADYAAAEADLRLQIARQYPDLHLGPGYAWNNGNAGDSEWILGATVELPLLNRNAGAIAEAKARRDLSAAKFVELQSQIIGEIDRALAGYRVAQGQLRTGVDLFQNEQKLQKSAEQQLAAGSGDELDVVNAELEVETAALGQLDNEAKLQGAAAALEDALQRPADSVAAVIAKLSAAEPGRTAK